MIDPAAGSIRLAVLDRGPRVAGVEEEAVLSMPAADHDMGGVGIGREHELVPLL